MIFFLLWMDDIFNRDIFKMVSTIYCRVYVIFCLKAVSIDSPCLLNTFTGSQYYINGNRKQSVHAWVPDRIWIKAPTCKTLLYLVLIKHMDNNVSFKCFQVCPMSHFIQAEQIHCPRCCDMTESVQVTCCSSEKTLYILSPSERKHFKNKEVWLYQNENIHVFLYIFNANRCL